MPINPATAPPNGIRIILDGERGSTLKAICDAIDSVSGLPNVPEAVSKALELLECGHKMSDRTNMRLSLMRPLTASGLLLIAKRLEMQR